MYTFQSPTKSHLREKGHGKDFVQTQGQAQDRTRATRGHFKDIKRLKRAHEDKPRTDIRQAEDKKGFTKGRHLREVQFYQNIYLTKAPQKLTCSSIFPQNMS